MVTTAIALIAPAAELSAQHRSSVPDDLSPILYIYADGGHRRVIDLAMDLVIAECMAAAGFEYVAPARAAADEADSILNGPIGLTERHRAVMFAYTAPEDLEPAVEQPMSSDPAFLAALGGPSLNDAPAIVDIVDPVTGEIIAGQERRGGCVADAEAAVYGAEADMFRFFGADYRLQNLGIESVVRALGDDDVVVANEEWSACMSQGGYVYALAIDPFNAPWPEPRPGASEIATAVTDVECKEEVEFLSVYRSALDREAQVLEAENVGVLEEWVRLYDDVLRRIAQLDPTILE